MIKKFSFIVYSLLAVFILSGCDDSSMGYAKLEENEVGILLNNITGTMTVETVAGMKMFMPVLKSFYTLDKREQTLEMTADSSSGSRFSKDDIKIKTIDGSDVYVDMTIQYRIIPSMADTIIMDSGPGQNYKFKWIRDYSRSIARLEFGELTTEEFYNSTKRTQKANEIRETLNIMLASHGLEVTNVIPQNFRFYAEYEKKIKEKKGADQEVDKQKSKAEAAKEQQKRRIIDAEREITIELTQFKGEQKQRVIQMLGEAKKAKYNADAYFYQTTIGADAKFYKMKQHSEAILAQKKSEAEGMEKMAEALEGKGGKNIVLREYVKNLKTLDLSAKPFLINNEVRKIHVTRDEEEASVTRTLK